MSRLFPFVALLVVLTGCSGATDALGNLTRAGADVRPLLVTDLRTDLAPYAVNPKYDYLAFTDASAAADGGEPEEAGAEPVVQYHVIGDREFDQLFFRSALMAGQFRQLSQTMAMYREEELSIERDQDAAFLTLMAAEAIDTLPSLVGDARGLFSQIQGLDTGRLSTLQKLRFGQASAEAIANLRSIIDSGSEVDDILNDYQQLQNDLDALEDPPLNPED